MAELYLFPPISRAKWWLTRFSQADAYFCTGIGLGKSCKPPFLSVLFILLGLCYCCCFCCCCCCFCCCCFCCCICCCFVLFCCFLLAIYFASVLMGDNPLEPSILLILATVIVYTGM